MLNAIKREIKRLSGRSIGKQHSKQNQAKKFALKYTKRTGFDSTQAETLGTLEYPHRHFDPKYCKRHANFIAKTIWFKLVTESYEPLPALKFELDKPGGGKRIVMQFSIPDAAVANVLNGKITNRNLKRQSANSFAYRPDRNLFDALLKLKSSIRRQRNYVLQLDFEKYFDNIQHPYILKLINDEKVISTTAIERKAITNFLSHKFADKKNYKISNFSKRTIGTPQGSTISLSLANLASHPLDFDLEAINGQFVRYADDTVVVSYTYEDAIRSYEMFNSHCAKSGLKINKLKSPGIWILSDGTEEIRSMVDFKFLGYGVSAQGLLMHNSVERRLQTKLSKLINLHLIQYIKKTLPKADRCGQGYDWDLLGLISEIRMMLYGGKSESQIEQFVKKGKGLRQLKGLMGFYALLDDKQALVRLDGWLATNITRALHKRYMILNKPIKTSKRELIAGLWYDAQSLNNSEFSPEVRLPSFVRGWAAAKKYQSIFGLDDVEPPKYFSYY